MTVLTSHYCAYCGVGFPTDEALAQHSIREFKIAQQNRKLREDTIQLLLWIGLWLLIAFAAILMAYLGG